MAATSGPLRDGPCEPDCGAAVDESVIAGSLAAESCGPTPVARTYSSFPEMLLDVLDALLLGEEVDLSVVQQLRDAVLAGQISHKVRAGCACDPGSGLEPELVCLLGEVMAGS